MTPEEARRQALLALGGIDQARERYRDMFRFAWLDALWRDIQFGLRTMRRSAGFTTLAVVTLAVGIAATNTAFTIMNAVMIRPLPFDAAERLVTVGTIVPEDGDSGVSYADFEDWERLTRAFAGIAAFQSGTMNVSDDDIAPERFLGTYVSVQTFTLLRVKPVLGRDFAAEEDVPAVRRSRSRCTACGRTGRGDPRVLGRTIRVNAHPATVIGVMPEAMEFPMNTAIWQPLAMMQGLASQPRGARTLAVFGRLADGVGVADAKAEMDAIAAALAEPFSPDQYRHARSYRTPAPRRWHTLVRHLQRADVGRRPAPAGELRQYREPAARESRSARARGVDSRVARSHSMAHRAPASDRKPHACDGGRAGGTSSVVGGVTVVCLSDGRDRQAPLDEFLHGRERARISERGVPRDGRPFRSGAGAGNFADRHERDAEGVSGQKCVVGKMDPAMEWGPGGGGSCRDRVLLAGAVSMMRFFFAQMDVTREMDTSRVLTMNLRLPNTAYPTAQERLVFYRRLEERFAAIPNASSIAVARVPPFLRQSSHELRVDGHCLRRCTASHGRCRERRGELLLKR